MPGRTETPEDPVANAQVDTEMDDNQSQLDGEYIEDTEETEGYDSTQQRVRILPGSTETAASFEVIDEGHTLGNALRFVVMKNPDVEFCAYSIPHPSENVMNIRIQTYSGPAVAALSKGLQDIQDMCDVVSDEFTKSLSEYKVDRMEA
ncbi:DNA-directed RNA polymerase [Plectosphaerella cucumerina]|uniref:DNA-directed RNA polymerase n=1 Tax=Plectosphaerella cucumerina TaxID=40658 RepID=A0A8K0TCQ7_9PEZI|nr:DNA-directed RNA polymerase [Plectosphaerella cucumerina]